MPKTRISAPGEASGIEEPLRYLSKEAARPSGIRPFENGYPFIEGGCLYLKWPYKDRETYTQALADTAGSAEALLLKSAKENMFAFDVPMRINYPKVMRTSGSRYSVYIGESPNEDSPRIEIYEQPAGDWRIAGIRDATWFADKLALCNVAWDFVTHLRPEVRMPKFRKREAAGVKMPNFMKKEVGGYSYEVVYPLLANFEDIRKEKLQSLEQRQWRSVSKVFKSERDGDELIFNSEAGRISLEGNTCVASGFSGINVLEITKVVATMLDSLRD